MRSTTDIFKLGKRVFAFFKFHLFGATNEEIESYAQELRQTAHEYGLENHFPVILTELERCTLCLTLTPVLMQPHNICGGCWIKLLNATIERDLQKV